MEFLEGPICHDGFSRLIDEKSILYCAHPDDETIGCGGAIIKHKCDGDINILTPQME